MTPLELSGIVAGCTLLVVAGAGLLELVRTRRRARLERENLGLALAASEAVSAALSEEALFLSGVLSAVDTVIILHDAEGRVHFVNERFEEVFGIRGADLIGRSRKHLHEQIARSCRDPDAFLAKSASTRELSLPMEETEIVIDRPVHRILLWSRRPVMQGQKQVGVIAVFRDVTRQREAEEGREKLMTELAARAATDALTSLANRRAAAEALATEIERARRYGRPLAVVLFDIDHFKRINDDFGHEAGDKVLKVFADVLKATARGSDIVARWGGEEFLAILHEADIDAGFAFAERVRSALTASNIAHHVTVSGGVASLREAETPEGLVRRADEALYEAKRTGRDRIVSAAAVPSVVPRDRSKRTLPPPTTD
jgi:diguanylate cyclase (GGDEF)-like protein/PAS domain S-box-containing protein